MRETNKMLYELIKKCPNILFIFYFMSRLTMFGINSLYIFMSCSNRQVSFFQCNFYSVIFQFLL